MAEGRSRRALWGPPRVRRTLERRWSIPTATDQKEVFAVDAIFDELMEAMLEEEVTEEKSDMDLEKERLEKRQAEERAKYYSLSSTLQRNKITFGYSLQLK